jgi:hypothetical protein
MKRVERGFGFTAVAVTLILAGCSNSNSDTGVTCGTGTTLVDRQCRATGVDPDAAPEEDPGVGSDDGGSGGNGSSQALDAGRGRDASPEAAAEASQAVPTPKVCADGGTLDADPCPLGPVIDCSHSCDNRLPCTAAPTGCAWSGQDRDSIQLDGTSPATIRTPEGDLETGACKSACGDAGGEQAVYSLAITSSHRWVKFTVPAPWRVVALDEDLCHPTDNHCLLFKNGAMILAPQACMPAKNILVEPVTDTASCL